MATPLPPTPSNVLRVAQSFNTNADPIATYRTYWAYTGGPPTVSILNTIASSIYTAWSTNLKAQLDQNSLATLVQVQDLANANGAVGSFTGSTLGTRAGTSKPISVIAVIGFTVARKYRGGKPKIFTPYGVDTDITNTYQWSSTFANGLTTAWANFQTAMAAISSGGVSIGAQQNVSYYHGSTPNTNTSQWARRNRPALRGTPVVDPIVTAVAKITFGSQRRRIAAS